MADALRKQIEQRLQIQKLQEIHAHFDNDEDGFLNHAELSALQTITSGQAISRKKYKAICSSFDCKPSQGLDFRALVMTYASGGEVSIDNDFDAVFGIQRPATQTESTSDVTEEKDVNTNGSANSQETSEINTVKSLLELLRAGDDPVITRTPVISNDKPPEMMDMLMKQVPSQELLAGVAITMGTISESKESSSKGSSSNSLTDIEPATESKAKKLQAPVEVQEDEEASDPATIVRPMEGISSSMSKSREKSVMGGSVYEDFLPRDRKEEDECCACSVM